MKIIERSALLATGLTAAALFVGGCGNSSSTETIRVEPGNPATPKEAGKIVCQAINLRQWEDIGNTALQVDKTAATLGVTGRQMQDGKVGEAKCDTPVPADPVGAGEGVVVTVNGQEGIENKKCLVVGLNSGGHPPEPHHAYHGIIAACAAPVGFANPA